MIIPNAPPLALAVRVNFNSMGLFKLFHSPETPPPMPMLKRVAPENMDDHWQAQENEELDVDENMKEKLAAQRDKEIAELRRGLDARQN